MKLSTHAQNFVNNSTCAHVTYLEKGGKQFIGYYNGLTPYATVEDGKGKTVENLSNSVEEDGYQPNWAEQDFVNAGYVVSIL